jgi:hypothetical protein
LDIVSISIIADIDNSRTIISSHQKNLLILGQKNSAGIKKID